MRIAVIGVGGVGGFFGGKLAFAAASGGERQVYFIARGAHLAAIRSEGLLLDTDEGISICRPYAATDGIAGIPPPDCCLVAVKGFDLEDAIRELAPLVGERTVIVPLLNGVDIRERIRALVPGGFVLPACVYVGTHIERPGKVTQRGGACTIVFGDDPERGPAGLDPAAVFEPAGIRYKRLSDPYPEIWGKFVFIAAFGMVTAASGLCLDAVLGDPALREQAEELMGEIVAVARARGVALPETIVADSLARAAQFPPGTKTSFQRDYEDAGRKDERDSFGGALLAMGAEAGLVLPVTAALSVALDSHKPAFWREPRIS